MVSTIRNISSGITGVVPNTTSGTARISSANVKNLTSQLLNSNSSIKKGLEKASEQNEAYLEEAKSLYEPYKETGLSSLDEYTKLLLGGVDSLSEDKNFQAMQDLAERKVMANRAVSGLMRSGATASALTDAELEFANKYYGNRLSQLLQGAGLGTQASGSQSSILEKLGTNATDLASALANIQMQKEANQAMVQAAEAQAGATKSAAKSASSSDMATGIIGGLATLASALIP